MYGCARENYLPIHLSQAFVAATIFGKQSISSEFLFHSFQLYISCGHLPPDDKDLLVVLSNYKCYRPITISGADMCRFYPELFIFGYKHQTLWNDRF